MQLDQQSIKNYNDELIEIDDKKIESTELTCFSDYGDVVLRVEFIQKISIFEIEESHVDLP